MVLKIVQRGTDDNAEIKDETYFYDCNQFKATRSNEGYVDIFMDFKDHHNMEPNHTLYVMNENGRTIDTIHT